MSEQNQDCGGAVAIGQICWFEIPSDDLQRANNFYSKLFGWRIAPFPGASDMLDVGTGQSEPSLHGGMMKRKHPMHQGITNYVNVRSVADSLSQVEKLGGKVCVPKTAVPFMGYFAVCQDTEGNNFGLWETDGGAK